MSRPRWNVLAALALLVVLGLPQARAGGAKALFNGKDLDGWVVEGNPGSDRLADGRPVWSVQDGLIRCEGKGFGFLRYDREQFSDFSLHVAFRMAPKCNSGIGIRTRQYDPKKSRETRPSIYSYEIQLIDDGKPPSPTSNGSLYRYVAPKENALEPAGEWNEIVVTCLGPKIRVVLNGRTIQDVDQSTIDVLKKKPLKGNVCLQNHGGRIEFRDVRVEEIAPGQGGLDVDLFRKARTGVVIPAGKDKGSLIGLEQKWAGDLCVSRLTNPGKEPVAVKEVVLFKVPHTLPPETPIYGEGFQMLSQTGGTLAKPEDLGGYTDRKHYRIPQPEDATVVYGVLALAPPGADRVLMGFTSCRRFSGRIQVRRGAIEVVLDTEGLTLEPGQTWELEEFLVASGPDRAVLFDRLSDRLRVNHPPRAFPKPPSGWCSWYCFGPGVTSAQILANLGAIRRDIAGLKYVQIDDGYQAAMGDWLEEGKAFGGGIRDVLGQIRKAGFEPAIWVAPFVAEKGSKVFRTHPDWFMKDAAGAPLASNVVSFGGWRRGPWYALDGTNPAVQKHLEDLFRTMRRDWGCTYFKLDANFWGALHGGKLHDPRATRVEAYRRGMEAVVRGAGDSFILGCNHPLWPSLGLIDGSRSSNDTGRKWGSFRATARENLSRAWQNGRLWWNDPDCVLLTGPLPDDALRFHATAAFATGGLVLSGDDLTKIPAPRLAMLRKLLPPTGVAARFEDESLRVGRVPLKEGEAVCLFNPGETPWPVSVALPKPCQVRDLWTDEDLGRREGTLILDPLPPRSARLLMCVPES